MIGLLAVSYSAQGSLRGSMISLCTSQPAYHLGHLCLGLQRVITTTTIIIIIIIIIFIIIYSHTC